MFGGLGPTEILVIVVIGLLVFGARRLPEIGKSLGKGIQEFKKGINTMRDEIEGAADSVKDINLDPDPLDEEEEAREALPSPKPKSSEKTKKKAKLEKPKSGKQKSVKQESGNTGGRKKGKNKRSKK